jgi:alanine-synthesizing transaminase
MGVWCEVGGVVNGRLGGVTYGIRGRLYEHAVRLKADGHPVLELNIGNPGAFGFRAPAHIAAHVAERLLDAQAYSLSKGLPKARRAVVAYSRGRGIPVRDEDDVYLGNGVSDLIMMTLQSLVSDGDEVLVPAPDYPLWTASVRLAGGHAVHYPCDESADWLPDLDALEARITDRTTALVVIDPNNPTGAVYPPELIEGLVELARAHDLVLLSDEIYDQILYDGATHTPTAALAPDLACVTFNGLSKAYMLAGYRSGWAVVTGPPWRTSGLRDGLATLVDMRLGANVPGQYALEAALGGDYGPSALVLPGGRLREQRDAAHAALTTVPGITCVKPRGGLYAFPRLDRSLWPVDDDEGLMLDILSGRRSFSRRAAPSTGRAPTISGS